MFINYLNALDGQELPPTGDVLMEYITAENGLFVRAKRPGLEAMIPVVNWGDCGIRGLASLQPYVRLTNGKIPADLIATSIGWMRESLPSELLVWITAGEKEYFATSPDQEAGPVHCKPDDPFDPDGQNALVDIHSHGRLRPFFSTTDNSDEKNGVRLYAVVGGFPDPEILVRVGIFGHFWYLPVWEVMELPDGLVEADEPGEVNDLTMTIDSPFGKNPIVRLRFDDTGSACDICSGRHLTADCPDADIDPDLLDFLKDLNGKDGRL